MIKTESLGSRTISRKATQGDKTIIERDEAGSCVNSSVENGSSSKVSISVPKEGILYNNLLEVLASDSSPVHQSWGTSTSEVARTATSSVQRFLSEKSAMGTRGQFIPETFIDPDRTIVAGAQLVPHVSDRNIGSIYNYSAINWLLPEDLSQIDRTIRGTLALPTGPLNVDVPNALTNGIRGQDMSPRLRLVIAHLPTYYT